METYQDAKMKLWLGKDRCRGKNCPGIGIQASGKPDEAGVVIRGFSSDRREKDTSERPTIIEGRYVI